MVWVGGGSEQVPTLLPIQTASRPLPHEQNRPSAVSHEDSTTGRCRGRVFSVRDVWVPNIKGDREFAVPIRASHSKPGARRIKAQSHLPANPGQECFLSGIVFFSYLQARCTAPTPTLRTGSHTPTLTGLDAPPFPDCPSTPLQRGCPGASYLAVMQVLWGKKRSWFPLWRLGIESHTCFHLLHIPTSSYFPNENPKQDNTMLLMMSKNLVALILLISIWDGIYSKVGTLRQGQGDTSHPALLALAAKSFVYLSLPPLTPPSLSCPSLAQLWYIFDRVRARDHNRTAEG